MRDIIWTVIILWVVYKLIDVFKNINQKKIINNQQSENSNTSVLKKDIKSAVQKSAEKEGEYVDYEEVK